MAFFLPLYGGKGCAIGSLNFQGPGDLAGNLNWSKAPMAKARFYPGGFVVNRAVTGGSYSPQPKGTPILTLTNGQVLFEGGGLLQNFSDPISVDPKNRITDAGSNGLTMVFKPKDGTFRGNAP